MSPIVADASVAIRGDLKPFMKDIKAADLQTQTLGQRMKSIFSPGGLGFTAAAAGIGAFTAGIGQAIGDLINMERLSAQTDAAIRATGGAAKVSREEIVGLAEGLEELTGKEMETTQEGANLLLTFKRIKNEVGAGNDIFNQATETALDLSVALGTDMRSASMMLGKALDDPIRGVTALRRAGVALTKAQEQQIKTFVESGDVLNAQKIILAELESQVGGSAEAFGQTTAGKMQKFQNAVGNFFEGVVTGAVDMVDDTGGLLNNFAMDAGDMGMRIHVVADRLGEDFTTVKDRVRDEMAETGKSFDDVMAGMEADAYEKAAGITDAMSEGTRFAAEALQRGGPVIAAEAGKIAGMFPSEIRMRIADIRRAGMDSVVAFATGILDKQNDPLLAMEALTKANEEALTRGEEIARLKGALTGDALAAGLTDSRPEVRLAAQAARAVILDRLETLGVSARGWGYNVGSEFADGLNNAIPLVEGAARGISSATGRQIGIESEPKAPDSGLRGITKWGGNLVKTYAEGMLGELGSLDRAASAMAGRLVPGFTAGDASEGLPAGPAPLASGAADGAGPAVVVHYSSVVPATEADKRQIDHVITEAVIGGLQRRGYLPRRPDRP